MGDEEMHTRTTRYLCAPTYAEGRNVARGLSKIAPTQPVELSSALSRPACALSVLSHHGIGIKLGFDTAAFKSERDIHHNTAPRRLINGEINTPT